MKGGFWETGTLWYIIISITVVVFIIIAIFIIIITLFKTGQKTAYNSSKHSNSSHLKQLIHKTFNWHGKKKKRIRVTQL